MNGLVWRGFVLILFLGCRCGVLVQEIFVGCVFLRDWCLLVFGLMLLRVSGGGILALCALPRHETQYSDTRTKKIATTALIKHLTHSK